MKKLKLLSIFLLLIVTALAGCSGSSNESSDSSSSDSGNSISSEPTELTYWTFQGTHIQFFEDAQEKWNKENPDRQIKLSLESFPFNDMHNNLLISLQTGVGAPDIVDIEINRYPNFLQGDIQLVELNDIVDPVKDNFVQSRLDIYAKDGKYYGLPTHVGATVMYYNTEILDQAGVSADDIETWDDFIEVGKTVVKETGIPMTTVHSTSSWTFWQMISQRGSDIFDENGEVILDNESNIETLEFINDLVYEHEIAIPTPGGNHSVEEYFGFMNQGGAATILMPMWYMSRFVDHMPDLKGKMIVRPLPTWEEGGNRSAGMGGTGTSITKQSEHVDLAKDFLAFAKLSKEGNINLWKILGFDPPRWDVWEDPALKEDNKYFQYFGSDIFDTLMDLKDEINPVNITDGTPLARDLLESQVMPYVLLEQSQTPEEALKEAAEQLRKE